MKKMVLLIGVFCFASIVSQVCGQSINNRNWKAYFADPINDTLTLHVRSDSSFVTTSKGDVMLRTNCIITGDTLWLGRFAGHPRFAEVLAEVAALLPPRQ